MFFNLTPQHPCVVLQPITEALSCSPSWMRCLTPHHPCVILFPIIHALSNSPSSMLYLTPHHPLSYSPASVRYLTPNHPCVVLFPWTTAPGVIKLIKFCDFIHIIFLTNATCACIDILNFIGFDSNRRQA